MGWSERRQRLDEVGSVWPVADDIELEPVDLDRVPGEWSMRHLSRSDLLLRQWLLLRLDLQSRRMVTEAGRAGAPRTLAVGYRLAPEHPFPAALHDMLTAWRFVRDEGWPAQSVAIGGDSAGGGLTVALINKLKKVRGDELPARVGSSLPGPTSQCLVRR